jgi:hypothetical protein
MLCLLLIRNYLLPVCCPAGCQPAVCTRGRALQLAAALQLGHGSVSLLSLHDRGIYCSVVRCSCQQASKHCAAYACSLLSLSDTWRISLSFHGIRVSWNGFWPDGNAASRWSIVLMYSRAYVGAVQGCGTAVLLSDSLTWHDKHAQPLTRPGQRAPHTLQYTIQYRK